MIVTIAAEMLAASNQCDTYNSYQIAPFGARTFFGFERVKYEIGAIPSSGTYGYAIGESFR